MSQHEEQVSVAHVRSKTSLKNYIYTIQCIHLYRICRFIRFTFQFNTVVSLYTNCLVRIIYCYHCMRAILVSENTYTAVIIGHSYLKSPLVFLKHCNFVALKVIHRNIKTIQSILIYMHINNISTIYIDLIFVSSKDLSTYYYKMLVTRHL